MFKKSFVAIMFAAMAIFSYGTAQAAVNNLPGFDSVAIDGLTSGAAQNSNHALPPDLHIFLNPGGLGDALIYGYYNARGGNTTVMKVVNTSSVYGVGAKVRFREGKNSNEVLDFYICLSAMDEFSGSVTDTIGGTQNPVAGFMFYDKDTPTFPDPDSTSTTVDNDATNNYQKVFSFHYSGTDAASSVTADDTKEGYFEIIANVAWKDTPGGAKLINTPNKCGKTVLTASEWAKLAIDETFSVSEIRVDAPNSLFGNAYVYDFYDKLGTYSYNASALANFRDTYILGQLGSDTTPTLNDATDSLHGVNFVLTKSMEYAVYDIQAWNSGATTIINTFPTKRLSIDKLHSYTNPNGPFNDSATLESDGTILTYDDTTTPKSGYRCEKVGIGVWDDAENTLGNPNCTTSPCNPTTREYTKCNEVSLLVVGDLKSAAITNSTLVDGNIDTKGIEYGWLFEDYTSSNGATIASRWTQYPAATSSSYLVAWAHGLPVISYELQPIFTPYLSHMLPLRYDVDVVNNIVGCSQGGYGTYINGVSVGSGSYYNCTYGANRPSDW